MRICRTFYVRCAAWIQIRMLAIFSYFIVLCDRLQPLFTFA